MPRGKINPSLNPRTVPGSLQMPKWIWQLEAKGFHLQLKKYVSFLWRFRPAGCNWSRALRARYFKRSVSTIRRWDRQLLNLHLVWATGQHTLYHRIGAMPYFKKQHWTFKKDVKRLEAAAQEQTSQLIPTRATNGPPYTA